MSKRGLVATKLYGATPQSRVMLNLQYCLQCSITATVLQHRTQLVTPRDAESPLQQQTVSTN